MVMQHQERLAVQVDSAVAVVVAHQQEAQVAQVAQVFFIFSTKEQL
jgi:hypothetical protein